MIPNGSRRWLSMFAAGVLAGHQAGPSGAQELSRESEIVFQIPGQSDLRVDSATVEVLENGTPRRVSAVDEVVERWRILVYFDMPGSTVEGVEAAATAIAGAADAMTALGDVEIVTADRLPEVHLAPTADAVALRRAASQLAPRAREAGRLFELRSQADVARTAPDSAQTSRLAADLFESLQLELDILAWQRASLVEAVEERGNPSEGRPRMLVLVQDAVDLDLGGFARRILGEPATSLELRARSEHRRQRSLTRTIAALGWRVYPLLAAPANQRVDALLPGRRAQPTRFAEASAGDVLANSKELNDATAVLSSSWRLRYLSRGLRDGAPHPVDVHLRSSAGPRGPTTRPRARRWATTVTPSDLVSFRAGQALDLVAGDVDETAAPGNSELAVRTVFLPQGIETLPDGIPSELVTVDGLVTFGKAPPKTSRTLRATIHGRGLDASPLLVHRLGTGAELDGATWRFRTLIDLPVAVDELVLIVEDLASDRWQAAFLEAGSHPLDERGDPELLTSDGSSVDLPPAMTEAAVLSAARAAERAPGRTSDRLPRSPRLAGSFEPPPNLIRLLPPRGLRTGLTGRQVFDTVAISDAVRRVEFYLDGVLILNDTRRPFSARVDLGKELDEHVVRAVAYDRSDRPLGDDRMPVNQVRSEGLVNFSTVVPGPNGSFDVVARVDLDDDQRLDRIEFYRNERLAATLNRPPYGTRLPGPAQPGADFARLAVHLEDGTVIEDVRFLSSNDLVEEALVNLVEVYAVVNDQEGQPITTLKREDFVLRAGRREIPIERFAVAEDVPLVLGLAVDTSESMYTIMPDVRRAAAQFVANVLTEIDQAFVVDFDSRPRLIADTTGDVVKLIGSLGELQADGLTALYDAMQFGLAHLARDQGRRALVILTDGDDYGSQSGYRKTFRTAGNTGVPIYVISMHNQSALGRGLRKHDLEAISKASGGRVYYVNNIGTLLWAYGHISRELQSQYMLGYSTDAPLTRQEVQALEVELRSGNGKSREVRMTVGRGRG